MLNERVSAAKKIASELHRAEDAIEAGSNDLVGIGALAKAS